MFARHPLLSLRVLHTPCARRGFITLHIVTLSPSIPSHRYGLPEELRTRARRFFLESREVARVHAFSHIEADMSPGLQGTCAVTLGGVWLRIVWYLKDIEGTLLSQLALRMKTRVFPKFEWIPDDRLYIVRRGVVMVNGTPRGVQRFWGEDIILNRVSMLRKTESARAMTFVALYSLEAIDLAEAAVK